jgi:hypothetical protein
MTSKITLPIAIVIAGALVAAAILFRRPEPPPARTASSPAPTANQSVVQAQAAAALAKLHDRLVHECWDPSVKADPGGPKTVRLTLDVTFGPDGVPLARGINEQRDAHRSDVTSCVSQHPVELKVDPPGQTVRVELPLTLP